MKKVKKVARILLCMVVCMSILAGCGGTGSQDTTPAGNEPASSTSNPSDATETPSTPPADAKYAKEMTIYSLPCSVIDPGNPAFYTAQVAWYCNNVYNTLVKLTSDWELKPALATSWETDDYQTYVFKLRDDVYFHNGEKFTADDVVFTIERGKQSKGTGAYDRWSQVESYEVVNDYEIILKAKTVNVDFINDVAAFHGCSILNREAVEADPDHGTWIGTGPWIVKDLVVKEYVEFTRNDKYWGELPKTEKLTFKNIPEQSAQLIALENGEIDSVQGLLPIYLMDLEKDDRFEKQKFTITNTAMIAFNMLDPLMSDINFRMAVAYAISRDDCVATTRSGYAIPANHMWGYDTQFKNTDIKPIERDIEKAKEYLAKTNYKGETIQIVAALNDHISNAQVIQANLKEIGINTEIYQTDLPGLAAYTPWGGTKHQMMVGSSSWTNVASSCKNIYYPGMSGNKANYDNPKVKELLDKATTTTDEKEREAIYKEVQEIVAQDMPYIPIFNMVYVIVSQKGVGGLDTYTSLNHDFSYAYRVIE
ncbi:MAG: ABC transporter substrate-binding protein [Bacillota bacterium]